MILNDELEQVAAAHDPTLVMSHDSSNIRSIAMFELAIMRAVLGRLLLNESTLNVHHPSMSVHEQEAIDTVALEKSLIELLSSDDEKHAIVNIDREFRGVGIRGLETFGSYHLITEMFV